MQLDVSRAFVTEGFSHCFTASLTPDSPWEGRAFTKPIGVSGKLENRAGVLSLSLHAVYEIGGPCDRCCEETSVSCETDVCVFLVREKQEEENDDIVVVSGDFFEIDELVNEAVMLSAPAKLLCKESCRGLCPLCGQNLNVKNCGCRQTQSPFDRLKQDFNS